MSLSTLGAISPSYRAPADYYLTASSPTDSSGSGFSFASIFSTVAEQAINLGFNVLNAKITQNITKGITPSAALQYNPVQGAQTPLSPASSAAAGTSVSANTSGIAGIGGGLILILIIGLVIFLIVRK